jgi:uncharacterized protein (DUF4415 family)
MSKKERPPLTDAAGEVRELTAEDFAEFRPIEEVLPGFVAAMKDYQRRKGRGPQRAPTKEQITIRLDSDIVSALRAGGEGWQTRLNDRLRGMILPPSDTTRV